MDGYIVLAILYFWDSQHNIGTVSETGRDVAEQHIETPVGSLEEHKFMELTEVNSEITELKDKDTSKESQNESLN